MEVAVAPMTEVESTAAADAAAVARTGWPSVNRRRSARRSSADWYRSAGAFSSACMVIRSSASGTAGLRSRSIGGALRTCIDATATGESPTNGVRPASISNSTTPSE